MKISVTPLQKMPLQQQLILICSGAIVLIIGFYFLFCQPKSLAIEVLRSQLQQQRMALVKTQQELSEMPDPAGYYVQLQEEDARGKSLLPDSEEITGLLVVLNALGKEQNIKIVSIKQNAFVDHKTYYEIPLELSVSGAYPDLLHFIGKMEKLQRFNSITKIGMRQEENLLIMQLAASVYVYGPMPQNAQTKSK